MINTVYCNAVDIKSKLMQFGFAYKIFINLENLYKISKTVKCQERKLNLYQYNDVIELIHRNII